MSDQMPTLTETSCLQIKREVYVSLSTLDSFLNSLKSYTLKLRIRRMEAVKENELALIREKRIAIMKEEEELAKHRALVDDWRDSLQANLATLRRYEEDRRDWNAMWNDLEDVMVLKAQTDLLLEETSTEQQEELDVILTTLERYEVEYAERRDLSATVSGYANEEIKDREKRLITGLIKLERGKESLRLRIAEVEARERKVKDKEAGLSPIQGESVDQAVSAFGPIRAQSSQSSIFGIKNKIQATTFWSGSSSSFNACPPTAPRSDLNDSEYASCEW